MTYEVTVQSNEYQEEKIINANAEVEADSLGEFLRSFLLGLGTVVLTSVTIYFAVAVVIELGLKSLN